MNVTRRVAIIGGGLAGLAAATALRSADVEVVLFESRRKLGGRAASFRDPLTGELIDHCQHVGMGCCVNLADFTRRTGGESLVTRHTTIHFIDSAGRRHKFAAARWLPAPLHLGPSLWRLKFLTRRERWSIARGLWGLAQLRPEETVGQTIGDWLARRGATPRERDQFWSVVLVSALGETLERASLSAARKVFVDGFLTSRTAYELVVPRLPLAELYGERVERWLRESGVEMRLETAVRRVEPTTTGVTIDSGSASGEPFAAAIVAVPWRRLPELFSAERRAEWPVLDEVACFAATPISGVHMWFDRPLTNLPHAVLIGGLAQWLFNRAADSSQESSAGGYYYQVVISASRSLTGRAAADVVAEVCRDLRRAFPAAADAQLVRARLVPEPEAVFSLTPAGERARPAQRTPWSGVYLAGDWTATGWPATLESAVRSGYLAAEAVLADRGAAARFVVPDLPRSRLARRLFPA